MKIKGNRKHSQLIRCADMKSADQYVMVSCWDAEHKPVNYLVNPKAEGWSFANFLMSFDYDIDVQWVTVYDAHGLSAGHTFFVMYLEDEDGSHSFHAVPLFTDMAIRFNKLWTMRTAALAMWGKRELDDDELGLIYDISIVDDCFATLTDRRQPERLRIRNITVGNCVRMHNRSHILYTQSINGQAHPFAYIPTQRYNELPAELELRGFNLQGQNHILTDFEANNLLKHIKYPVNR